MSEIKRINVDFRRVLFDRIDKATERMAMSRNALIVQLVESSLNRLESVDYDIAPALGAKLGMSHPPQRASAPVPMPHGPGTRRFDPMATDH